MLGPDNITQDELAKIISSAIGKEVPLLFVFGRIVSCFLYISTSCSVHRMRCVYVYFTPVPLCASHAAQVKYVNTGDEGVRDYLTKAGMPSQAVEAVRLPLLASNDTDTIASKCD